MKAIINSSGTLIVTPENETETYALIKWNSDYINKSGAQLVIDISNTPMSRILQEKISGKK